MYKVFRSQLGVWRLHVLVLVLVVIAEFIYIQEIPVGFGTILLLPLLFSFILGALMNPNVTGIFKRIVTEKEVKAASPLIVIAIMPFIAKFGTLIGPAMETLATAGPALILQELGNLATMLIALPAAVLVFRMRRESIGATYSIAREPNIAIIADRYGLTSDEGAGVMGVYVVGTMFGTIFFAVIASLAATMDLFHPIALAMACGVGSGSMMAACSGSLAELIPEMKDEILAFAGASNILTNATGLYVGLFVALPIAELLYRWLSREKPGEAGGGEAE